MNHKNIKAKKVSTSMFLILLIALSTIAGTLTLTQAHSPAWEIPTYL
jgi:hypothetical protein